MNTVRNLNLSNVNFASKKHRKCAQSGHFDNTIQDGGKKSMKALKWIGIIAAASIAAGGGAYLAYKKGKIDGQKISDMLLRTKAAAMSAGATINKAGRATAPAAACAAGVAITANQINQMRSSKLSGKSNISYIEDYFDIPTEVYLKERIENFNEAQKHRIDDPDFEVFKDYVIQLSPQTLRLLSDDNLAFLLSGTSDNKIPQRIKKIQELESTFTPENLMILSEKYKASDFAAWLVMPDDSPGAQRFVKDVQFRTENPDYVEPPIAEELPPMEPPKQKNKLQNILKLIVNRAAAL